MNVCTSLLPASVPGPPRLFSAPGALVPGDPRGGVPPTLRETIVNIYLKLGGLGLSEGRGLHSQQLEKADWDREREGTRRGRVG